MAEVREIPADEAAEAMDGIIGLIDEILARVGSNAIFGPTLDEAEAMMEPLRHMAEMRKPSRERAMAAQAQLPVIGGMQVRWLCSFCYAMSFSEERPSSWKQIRWMSATGSIDDESVCPACIERTEAAGGFDRVLFGAYADGPDPRVHDGR